MISTLYLTHPTDATTVHTMDGEPDTYMVARGIPPTSAAALAFIAGENEAAEFMRRCARDLAQPGELAQRVGASHDPGRAGFLARVEKALSAHLRGVGA